MSNTDSAVVTVRYMIDDVDAAVAFYTKHFGLRQVPMPQVAQETAVCSKASASNA